MTPGVTSGLLNRNGIATPNSRGIALHIPCANLCKNVHYTDRNMETNEYDEPLYDLAVSFVIDKQDASTGFLQRQFRIGYNRADCMLQLMEKNEIVSTQGIDGNRIVLFSNLDEWLEYCRAQITVEKDIDMTNVILWPGKK